MKSTCFIVLAAIFVALAPLHGQPSPEPKSDVSNKALITKATPAVIPAASKSGTADIAALRKMADEYYAWRNENYPSAAAIPGCTPGTID